MACGKENIINEGNLEEDKLTKWYAKLISDVLNRSSEGTARINALAFKYVSFDAKTIASEFRKKAARYPIAAADEPTLQYKTMKLHQKCDVKTDLIFFINLFLEGGNNVPKILKKVTKLAEEALIQRKCAAYGIDYRTPKSKKHLSSTDLTLSRIARAFPVDTAAEILRTKSRGILTSKLFQQDLPLVMQHTIFAGLIPVTQFKDELKGIAVILNMEVTLILGSTKEKEKMAEQNVGQLIEASKKYVEEAIHAETYDDAAKLKVLTEAGILNMNDSGEIELSTVTMELLKQLPEIEAVYSLKYPEAVDQLKSK